MRWRMREQYHRGPIKLTTTGQEPIYLVVDQNGYFETEGITDFPLYAFADRVRVPSPELSVN